MPAVNDEIVHLISCYDAVDAHLKQGLLETNGIKTFIYSNGVGAVTGNLEEVISEFKIFVAVNDLPMAKQLILEAQDAIKYDDDSAEYFRDKKVRGKKIGRIMMLFIALFFAVLAFFLPDSVFLIKDLFFKIIIIFSSIFFIVLFFLSFDWSKKS